MNYIPQKMIKVILYSFIERKGIESFMKKIIILIFLVMLIVPIKSNANTIVELKTNSTKINIDEEFSINVNISGNNVSAMDLEIYFDPDKIEYISGPINSNIVNGKIKLSWYDGNVEGKTNFSLGDFIFKQKQKGKTTISINGNSYDEIGNLLETEFKDIQIGEIIENTNGKIIAQEEVGTSTDINNAVLKILRTNQEEIIPKFDTNIKEYYLTTNKEIDKLDITAIPDNPDSKVEIIGNENFIQGKNIVEIKITSPNGKITNSYKIYVTRTKDIEKSNANLENLAIENMILYPSFDTTVTEYRIETEPNIERLNILAIPENPKAKITIQGNELLKTGDNEILINVLSEDGINSINYKIIAHKRNIDEQEQYIEQEEKQSETLNNLLEEANVEQVEENKNINEEINKENNEKKLNYIYIILIVTIGIIIILFIIIKTRQIKDFTKK